MDRNSIAPRLIGIRRRAASVSLERAGDRAADAPHRSRWWHHKDISGSPRSRLGALCGDRGRRAGSERRGSRWQVSIGIFASCTKIRRPSPITTFTRWGGTGMCSAIGIRRSSGDPGGAACRL